MAPGEPAASQCPSSTTRHTAVGARRHTASATVPGSGASSVVPGTTPAARSRPPALTAAITSRAKTTPSASPWSRPIQTSSPRGASRFSATAWASSVVLPRPGPPTTDVTRYSQRPSRARSSRDRVSEPGRGSGGSGTHARLAAPPLLRFGHPLPSLAEVPGALCRRTRPPVPSLGLARTSWAQRRSERTVADCRVDEVADGIYRISTYLPDVVVSHGLTINQFLVLA